MTARALLREAVAGAAHSGPNVIVQIDHWALLAPTMSLEKAADELTIGYSAVRRLVKAGKLRRVEDLPGFIVETASVRKLVEG